MGKTCRIGCVLLGICGLCLLHACSSQDTEVTAKKNQSDPSDTVKSTTKGRTMPKFNKAKITRYFKTSEGVPQTNSTEITDPKQLRRLTSFFPGLGEGKESPTAATYKPYARIELSRSDGQKLTVIVDPEFTCWSEGQGDWDVAAPDDCRTYFR